MSKDKLEWIRVGHVDDLPEGRVKTVTARNVSICLSHFEGQWAAMDNHCPHQGGPLGEGSIEKGVEDKCWIRCPWHGWDFDPLTGANLPAATRTPASSSMMWKCAAKTCSSVSKPSLSASEP